jgi:hypothetical protein
METGVPWTVPSVRKHVADLHGTLVGLWMNNEDMPSLAFLFLDDGRCILVPDLNEIPKSAVPTALRILAADTGAQYVAFAADAYSLVDVPPDEVEAWYATGKSLSQHPNMRRMLVVSVDGPGLSDMNMTVLDADGVPVTEVSTGGIEGRMTNLSGRMGEN